MLSSIDLLIEEKNLHMTHAEDAVLDAGVDGTRRVINYFQAIRDMLAGHTASPVNLTIKWDGAPAIFAGTDPSDGRFFVAKKGIFNKNPKVYKTPSDIDADISSSDLAHKMKLALQYLPDLNIKGVIQGDFLYSKKDLYTVDIDDTPHIAFHPNTIVYTIPKTSGLADQILKSQFGIVWHTSYRGNSFEAMSADFGKPIAKHLRSTKNVWSVDAQFQDISGLATFTKEETYALTDLLREAGRIFKATDAATFNGIAIDPDRLIRVKAYINSRIKENERISNPELFVRAMVKNIMDYYAKEEESRKTDAGKIKIQEKRDSVLSYFSNTPPQQLINLFKLYNLLIDVKLIIISKLNRAKNINTLVLTPKGYRVVGHEGYVAIDHVGKNALKLIDRLEFSRSNFSADIAKGWQK